MTDTMSGVLLVGPGGGRLSREVSMAAPFLPPNPHAAPLASVIMPSSFDFVQLRV
jgi:hypothetical protein